MISQKPHKIVLILAATLFMTGCSLKPRQTSRFHAVSASGHCNCYSCRSCGGYDEDVPNNQAPVYNDVIASPISEAVVEQKVPASSTVPALSKPRKLYEFTEEPVVSKDSFQALETSSPELNSNPVNEVDADASPSDNVLELATDVLEQPEGSAFKPATPKKQLTEFEAPKSLEPVAETKTAVEPKVIADTKPLFEPTAPIKPTPAEPTPAAPTPVAEPVKPALPAKTPTPTSNFIPGETFKPRKKPVAPLDSSSLDRSSGFKGLEPFAPESNSSEPNTTFAEKAEPVAMPKDDPVDSFFGKDQFASSAKQIPRPVDGSKIVLRANPVERNVVYRPPSKSDSNVAVPALQASFKAGANENWLRDMAHSGNPSVQVAANNNGYPQTDAAAIVPQAQVNVQQTIQPVQPIEPQPIQTQPVDVGVRSIEAQPEPQKIAVRLRAIPMDERMIKGQQVEVRFREHFTEPEDIKHWTTQ